MIGMVRFYVYPIDTATEYEFGTFDPLVFCQNADKFSMAHQLPHVDCDLSLVTTQELRLPFPKNREYMSMAALSNEVDYYLYSEVVNPPESIQGVTPPVISFQIYVRYENVTLDRIIPQGALEEHQDKGSLARMLHIGAHIARQLPFSFATPASMALEAGSSLASYMGWSRPPSEPSDSRFMFRIPNTAAASDAPDFSFGLSTTPFVSRNLAQPIPFAEKGDTSIDFYKYRWGQIYKSLEQELGVYETIIADPGLCVRNTGINFLPVPTSFITNCFDYWTGDVEFCIEVVGSPLVRWRLGVVIIPVGVVTPVAFPDEGYITHTFEVAGTTCHEITVPYLYLEPFQKTRFVYSNQNHDNISFTRFKIFSLTEPTGPAAIPVKPRINIYVRGGKNLSLGVPSLENYVPLKITPQGLGLQSIATFGEEIEDIHMLMKRPVETYYVPRVIGGFGVPVLPCPPTDDYVLLRDNTIGVDYIYSAFNWVSLFTPLYWGNLGGVTHRMLMDNPPDATYKHDDELFITNVRTMVPGDETIGLSPTLYGIQTNFGRGGQLLAEDNDMVIGARVPDRNLYQFRHPNVQNGAASKQMECVYLGLLRESVAEYHVQTFSSAADDYRVGGYLCIPSFYTRRTTPASLLRETEPAIVLETLAQPALTRQPPAVDPKYVREDMRGTIEVEPLVSMEDDKRRGVTFMSNPGLEDEFL
jgi:hypothetical protein